MLARMWRKGNLHILLGLQIRAATMENSIEIPKKIKESCHIVSHATCFLQS